MFDELFPSQLSQWTYSESAQYFTVSLRRICFSFSAAESNILILEPINGWVTKASATQTVDSGSIPSRVKPETKNWYSQLLCWIFSIKMDNVKPPPCVVDRCADGSLARRPKLPSKFSGQVSLVKEDVTTISKLMKMNGLCWHFKSRLVVLCSLRSFFLFVWYWE